jgi:hypothetical protein
LAFLSIAFKNGNFVWSQKNDAIIILSDFSHENVPDGSRDFMPFFRSIALKMENLWSKKMMPFLFSLDWS